MKFTILVDPCLAIITFYFVLSMPKSRENFFKRYNAFPLYDLYGHTLAQNPCSGDHENYNIG